MSAALDGKAAWIKEAKAQVCVKPAEVNTSRSVSFTELKVTRHLLTILLDRIQCVPPIRRQTPAVRLLRSVIFSASVGGTVVSSGSAEFGTGKSVVPSPPVYFWRDNSYSIFQRYALVRPSNDIKAIGDGHNVLDAVTIATQAREACGRQDQLASCNAGRRPVANQSCSDARDVQ